MFFEVHLQSLKGASNHFNWPFPLGHLKFVRWLVSGRPKQFLDRNTKTENDTSVKPSFGRNQLTDQTISVLAKTVSFGRNGLFWPKQSLLAKFVFDSVVHMARLIWTVILKCVTLFPLFPHSKLIKMNNNSKCDAGGKQDAETTAVWNPNATISAERVVFGQNRCYLAETVCFGRYGGKSIWSWTVLAK